MRVNVGTSRISDAQGQLLARARRGGSGLLEGLIEELAKGRVDPARLLINRRLSKEPGAYKVKTMSAEAAIQLSQARIRLHPGEQIKYLVINSSRATPSSRKLPLPQVRVLAEAFVEGAPNYDVAYYETLLRAAADEVLT